MHIFYLVQGAHFKFVILGAYQNNAPLGPLGGNILQAYHIQPDVLQGAHIANNRPWQVFHIGGHGYLLFVGKYFQVAALAYVKGIGVVLAAIIGQVGGDGYTDIASFDQPGLQLRAGFFPVVDNKQVIARIIDAYRQHWQQL